MESAGPRGTRRTHCRAALSIRAHDVSAYRASHGRRDVAHAFASRGIAAGVVYRGVAGTGGGSWLRTWRLGDDNDATRNCRSAGDGHTSHAGDVGGRPTHTSRRAALSLGLSRPGDG